jgi:hypothetical protein
MRTTTPTPTHTAPATVRPSLHPTRQVTTTVVVQQSQPATVRPRAASATASNPALPTPRAAGPSTVARTASASFTLTCPVATMLTATGTGAGINTLTLTGPGVRRSGSGRHVGFTVEVQAGSYTATDTDGGGQPSVGLRQSVGASQACHS